MEIKQFVVAQWTRNRRNWKAIITVNLEIEYAGPIGYISY
jgi:hypothetical protein